MFPPLSPARSHSHSPSRPFSSRSRSSSLSPPRFPPRSVYRSTVASEYQQFLEQQKKRRNDIHIATVDQSDSASPSASASVSASSVSSLSSSVSLSRSDFVSADFPLRFDFSPSQLYTEFGYSPPASDSAADRSALAELQAALKMFPKVSFIEQQQIREIEALKTKLKELHKINQRVVNNRVAMSERKSRKEINQTNKNKTKEKENKSIANKQPKANQHSNTEPEAAKSRSAEQPQPIAEPARCLIRRDLLSALEADSFAVKLLTMERIIRERRENKFQQERNIAPNRIVAIAIQNQHNDKKGKHSDSSQPAAASSAPASRVRSTDFYLALYDSNNLSDLMADELYDPASAYEHKQFYEETDYQTDQYINQAINEIKKEEMERKNQNLETNGSNSPKQPQSMAPAQVTS